MMFILSLFSKFICGFIIVCTVVWLFLRWNLRIYFERFKNVKSLPGGLPFPIGHGHRLVGKNCQEIFQFLDTNFLQYGREPRKVWFGPIFTLCVANVHDTNIILTSPHGLQKHWVYSCFRNVTGLATAPVDQWRLSRKLLSPTFNFNMLKSFIPIFNECSAKMVHSLRPHTTGKLFNCSNEIFVCALSMACLTTLGFDLNLQEYGIPNFLEMLVTSTGLMIKRMVNIWLYPDFIYNFTRDSKTTDEIFKIMYKVTEDIVRVKKAEYDSMTEAERCTICDEYDLQKPKIFLTQILHLAEANNLSDLYIREQVDTMIFAGSETSALTVAYVALMLAMHPTIQERVYQEIMSVTSGCEIIDYGMISKLDYTEQVIKETLRLYPVAPFVLRQTTGDVKISNCTIPKNCDVLISIFHLHRDKEIWGPDAELFNPDNFLPEKIKSRHPASFIPFSYGPRNCIAMRYGMMSMKVMVCHLIQNYQLSTPMKQSELQFELHITLRLVENKFMIQLCKRNNKILEK